jgi:hypothetical protein
MGRDIRSLHFTWIMATWMILLVLQERSNINILCIVITSTLPIRLRLLLVPSLPPRSWSAVWWSTWLSYQVIFLLLFVDLRQIILGCKWLVLVMGGSGGIIRCGQVRNVGWVSIVLLAHLRLTIQILVLLSSLAYMRLHSIIISNSVLVRVSTVNSLRACGLLL